MRYTLVMSDWGVMPNLMQQGTVGKKEGDKEQYSLFLILIIILAVFKASETHKEPFVPQVMK